MLSVTCEQMVLGQELQHLLTSGSLDDFSKLYDLCAPIIYGIILKIIENESLAEEVLVQTFLEIYKKAHNFNPKTHFPLTWMLSIAINNTMPHVKDKQDIYARIRDVMHRPY